MAGFEVTTEANGVSHIKKTRLLVQTLHRQIRRKPKQTK
jgi:hypothetical protein